MVAILKHISGTSSSSSIGRSNSSSSTLAQVVASITALLLVMVVVVPLPTAHGIDCFKCVSMNGANKACDDPFHNNYSAAILESPCMGGRKGRDGLFPATSCIKIAGYYDDTGETITVRGCALDSGTLTTDTEIIRMSHCGRFYYDDRYVHGCLQSCNDADACNAAQPSARSCSPTLPLVVVIVALGTALFGSVTIPPQPSGWLRIVNGS
uniref:Protein sleepless n=1 Tax=Anopheles arabiensis TaxID=7173 RepID=A0A182HSQ6_ANOAR